MQKSTLTSSKSRGRPQKSEDPLRFRRRREPQQQRSRVAVANIKEAALALARERGFRDLTTEQISARAGVNIGSLYQYFPNREAILLSLYEDVSSQLITKMRDLTLEIFDAPLASAAAVAMEGLLATYERHAMVLIHMLDEIPALQIAVRPISFHNLNRGTLRNFIQHRRRNPTPREIHRGTFFIENIALGCIKSYLLEERGNISRKEFIQDLAWILTAYLNQRAA